MTVNNFSLAKKLSKDNVVSIGSPVSVISYLSETQEEPKRELAEKLLRFREQSKAELQKSWDEVESLQKECAISTARIAQHDNAIDEMRRKEKAWQGCCLIAEEKLREKLEKANSLQCHIKLSSPQHKQSLEDGNDEANLQKISKQRGSSRYNKILSFPKSGRSLAPKSGRSLACQNDDQNELELALKISSRDEAISSLEQVLDENIKSTQNLQAELQSLVVTHRMRDKEIYDSHAQKEEDFKGQVEALRKELSDAMSRNESY
mmetsp:Transcript_26042/g.30692  ORF Transcript_26042/g.30692 Transcript_26042/m.30692 type:complete len:263 (+) Transcript_26042:35-823(+)